MLSTIRRRKRRSIQKRSDPQVASEKDSEAGRLTGNKNPQILDKPKSSWLTLFGCGLSIQVGLQSTTTATVNLTQPTAGTILTFFGDGADDGTTDSGVADLRKAIYDDINGDPYLATQARNVMEFAALIVRHAVTVFLEQKEDNDLEVFRIFEEYISILVRPVVNLETS
jgi:hypothetical protein